MRLLDPGADTTEPSYDITVHDSGGETAVYRTLKLLSDSGATQGPHTRGTRIWKVLRLVDGKVSGDPVVLKDSWVSEKRQRESTNLRELLETELPEELDRVAKISFLTLQTSGDVYLDNKREHVDRTLLLEPASPDTSLADTSEEPSSSALVSQEEVHHKVHHRVVFEEIGTPLYSETSLQTIFESLAQTSEGTSIIDLYAASC